MTLGEPPFEPDLLADAAYPTTTPPDAAFPCQSREPLAPPLDGVATPAIVSRLVRPMERALRELWERLGLRQANQPERWVSIHYGRIALNAHGWERLRASATASVPDAALVAPSGPGIQQLPELWEALWLRLGRRRLLTRLDRAVDTGEELLVKAVETEWRDLPTAELSRGLLDERAWCEILLPYFGLRLLAKSLARPRSRVQAAVTLEQRCSAEVGRRLAAEGVLFNPSDVAYLTVEERTRAVHEASPFWMKVVTARMRRVEEFVELDVPLRFWGQPRVEKDPTAS